MPITPADLGGDQDLARRVLARARRMVPCLDALHDVELTAAAESILKAVMREIPAPGAGRVRSQSRNGTSISYDAPGSWFSDDDIADLRALCGRTGNRAGLPRGSFPLARPLQNVWPEGEYS